MLHGKILSFRPSSHALTSRPGDTGAGRHPIKWLEKAVPIKSSGSGGPLGARACGLLGILKDRYFVQRYSYHAKPEDRATLESDLSAALGATDGWAGQKCPASSLIHPELPQSDKLKNVQVHTLVLLQSAVYLPNCILMS
jgi:hypothetical protein